MHFVKHNRIQAVSKRFYRPQPSLGTECQLHLNKQRAHRERMPLKEALWSALLQKIHILSYVISCHLRHILTPLSPSSLPCVLPAVCSMVLLARSQKDTCMAHYNNHIMDVRTLHILSTGNTSARWFRHRWRVLHTAVTKTPHSLLVCHTDFPISIAITPIWIHNDAPCKLTPSHTTPQRLIVG